MGSTEEHGDRIPDRIRWSRRERSILTFGAAFLAVQLAVPALAPRHGILRQFAWEMYARSAPVPGFTVLLADGSERPIALTDVTVSPRGDVWYEKYLPPHLCETIAGAQAVRVSGPSDQTVVVSCQ